MQVGDSPGGVRQGQGESPLCCSLMCVLVILLIFFTGSGSEHPAFSPEAWRRARDLSAVEFATCSRAGALAWGAPLPCPPPAQCPTHLCSQLDARKWPCSPTPGPPIKSNSSRHGGQCPQEWGGSLPGIKVWQQWTLSLWASRWGQQIQHLATSWTLGPVHRLSLGLSFLILVPVPTRLRARSGHLEKGE